MRCNKRLELVACIGSANEESSKLRSLRSVPAPEKLHNSGTEHKIGFVINVVAVVVVVVNPADLAQVQVTTFNLRLAVSLKFLDVVTN